MSDVVRRYYDTNVEREWRRFEHPYQRIEFITSLALIDRYFPLTGHIGDIGCGPGRYAIEMLKRGYHVTLFDLSERALAFAQEKIVALNVAAEDLINGDARDLSMLDDALFDGLLLMGPMYHVIEAADRQQVLTEVHRVLKPGGIALIAYLNSWGVMQIGLRDFPALYSDLDFMQQMLDSWSQEEPHNGFTEAYFTTPPAALEEVRRAGFEVLTYAGAESFAQGMITSIEEMARKHPVAYSNVLQMAAETCELPQYRAATDHLHVVVQRPN